MQSKTRGFVAALAQDGFVLHANPRGWAYLKEFLDMSLALNSKTQEWFRDKLQGLRIWEFPKNGDPNIVP